jgi:hypothetical protein
VLTALPVLPFVAMCFQMVSEEGVGWSQNQSRAICYVYIYIYHSDQNQEAE